MSEVAEFPVDDYLVERTNRAVLPAKLVCVDDRPVALDELDSLQLDVPVVKAPKGEKHLYWQLAGGGDGLGRDMAVALEAQESNGFIKHNAQVHRMGMFIKSVLRKHGTEPMMHESCKAYEAAVDVSELIVSQPETVLARAQHFDSGISSDTFEKVQAAHSRLLNNQLVARPKDADEDLLNGVPEEDLPALKRLRLVPSPHVSGLFILDHNDDALWNSRKAFAEGKPAYYAGIGILRAAHERIEPEIAVTYESLHAAAIIRHAAVSLALTKPDGSGLDTLVRHAE